MQIQIKNIGKVQDAIINIDGLSVIAGNNDSGKSTVSKIIFSVIKAFQKYEEFTETLKENIIRDEIEKMYRYTRSIHTILSNKKYDTFYVNDSGYILDILKNEFSPDSFIEGLENSQNINFIKDKKSTIKKLNFNDLLKEDLFKSLSKIEKEYFREETKEYKIEKALNKIFFREFEGDISNNKKGEIIVTDGELPLFNIKIKENKVSEINIQDSIIKIKDSTFIESPIILNLFNNVDYLWKFQLHFEDLIKKIRNINVKSGDRKNGFWKKVQKIIGGTFELKKEFTRAELSFNKNGVKNNIKTINTATGIKVFGLLDLLDQGNNLNSDNLLILDEPEVHLHPLWQVEYAKLIVALIKERELSILITSHSPYMIEALDKYSREEKIESSFYLAVEQKNDLSKIENKTEDKNAIFEKLAEPFENLVLN